MSCSEKVSKGCAVCARKHSCAMTFMVMYKVEPIHLHSLEFRNDAFKSRKKSWNSKRSKKNDKPFAAPLCQTFFYLLNRIGIEAFWISQKLRIHYGQPFVYISCAYVGYIGWLWGRERRWRIGEGEEEIDQWPNYVQLSMPAARSFGHEDFKAINNSQLSWHTICVWCRETCAFFRSLWIVQ